MDRGAWRDRVCGGHKELDTTKQLSYHITQGYTAQAKTQVGSQTQMFRSFIHLVFSILCFYKKLLVLLRQTNNPICLVPPVKSKDNEELTR